MKVKLSHILLFILIFSKLSAQEGGPLLSSFKESSDIENQSWSICQDANNVMMFANRRGIMTFDGQSWGFITLPAVPYALRYYPGDKRVYAGCENNYGYLEKDEKGFYKYYSLSGDSSGVGLTGNIFFTDSTVCFYSEIAISWHDIKTGILLNRLTAKVNEPFSGMFISPKNTFINVKSKGLYRVEADTLFPIVTGYLLENDEVLFSLPYDKKQVLLGLDNGSLSIFDGIKFYDYKIKDEGYLQRNILSEGIAVSDSIYAFSTLDGGAMVVEKKSGKLLYTINYQNGLPDDEVFSMGSDNQNGLWLSHQYGLTRAELGLPVGNFSIYPGIKGNLITSAWCNNELFVATSEGVFYLTEVKNYNEVEVLVRTENVKPDFSFNVETIAPEPKVQETKKTKKNLLSRIFGRKTTPVQEEPPKAPVPERPDIPKVKVKEIAETRFVKKTISKLKSVNYTFKKVDGLNEKCKQLVCTPYGILASTNKALFNISGHAAKIIINDQYINFISKKSQDNKYYIATSEGYFYVTVKSGTWTTIFPDKNFIQPLYSIASADNGIIWAGGNSAAYKITRSKGESSVTYQTYTIKNDFPNKYVVENINDTIFLLAESGISFYDRNFDTFRKYIGTGLKAVSKLNFIISQPEYPWYKQGDEWINMSANEKIAVNDKSFLKILNEVISICLSDKYLWVVASDNQLFRIERNKNLSIKPDLNLYIRSISNDEGLNFNLSDIVFRRGDNLVYFDLVAPGYLKQNSTRYQYQLKGMMNDWSKWSAASTIALMPPPGSHTLQVRAMDIWGNISDPKILRFTTKAPFTHTTIFYILVSLIILFIIIIIVRFREVKLKNDKRILEDKVKERTAEIVAQKEEITSSIEYASRIQRAMLPEESHFMNSFSDYFIIFKPRDIVSGDFYWIGENDKHIFFTVADCTGHGVPGAFMSTLGISTLNEIIANKNDLQANTVLSLLRDKIKTSLHQTGKDGEAVDGMDVAFCVLHKNRKTLEFSGAYNPLFIFQEGELKEYKADRMPIGIYYGEKDKFTNYEINIKKNDTLYIFSDGFVDQFGGRDGVKYKTSKLKKLLAGIYSKPMAEQRRIIEDEFEKWRGSSDQVDDITFIGVRI